ncbi:hypothetical protein ACIBAH_23370 [Streptomyces sp. NPDC051445]|uniref:hypothetical protein n=1 Tax=Streptomyces sp. NPDC051445 TaxID=3365653 RepID=UPI00378EEF1E
MTAMTAMSAASDDAGDVREHACASPAHDQCGGKTVVDTPTTGPGPHPQPLDPPVRPDARPASATSAIVMHTIAARAPDLHLLQVLRT